MADSGKEDRSDHLSPPPKNFAELQPPLPDSAHAAANNHTLLIKFAMFALLFNALFYCLALFVQIRGWVDVAASYILLFAMWIIWGNDLLGNGSPSKTSAKIAANYFMFNSLGSRPAGLERLGAKAPGG